MNYGPIAERYARAVFELGVETGQLELLTTQLQAFATAYSESAELRSVLDNPLVADDKREAILKEVVARLGLSELAVNTVRLLASRRKLRLLPELGRRLGRLTDERAGVVRATVTSATELPEEYYQRLTATLERTTLRKVVLERKRDPSLIAGVVTRIGDNTIDGSLRGRLTDLERRLLQA